MLPWPRFLLVFPISIVFVAASPALAQVEPSATGTAGGSLDESEMMTPPPVSGIPYANTAGSDARSNYLVGGVAVTGGYIDNVLPSATSAPVSDFTYSILPSLALDRSSVRQQEHFSYSPYITFYQPTNSLDSFDQSAAATYQYRFSPEVAIGVQDNFARTSDVFNSPYVFSSTVSGSPLAPTPTVIAPFAEQLTNTLNGVLSYQFARNAMIGGGGTYAIFDIPNSAQAPGILSSKEGEGQAFYNRRLSGTQYVGLTYQYARVVADLTNGTSETQTHTLLPFYTVYFNRKFSISLSAGIERVDSSEPQVPASSSWTPSALISMGWQNGRGNFAASYSHSVTAGGGLVGAYGSNSADASGGWKLARTWNSAASAGYVSLNSATQASVLPFQNGNTLTVSGTLQHSMGEHFSASFQYQHLHEIYGGIAAISPDSNRESVTITYEFRRPLGR